MRLIATNKLTSYLKDFPKDEVLSLLKDFTIKSLPLNKNLLIKKGDVNSISELQEFLQRRLVDLITVLENQSYQEYDEIKGWLIYLTRYPKVSFFIYNNFSNIFKLDEDEFRFYVLSNDVHKKYELVVEEINILTKKNAV